MTLRAPVVRNIGANSGLMRAKASPGPFAHIAVAPVPKAVDGLRAAVPTYGRSELGKPAKSRFGRGIEERSQFLEQDWSSQSDWAGLRR
jgi:hypothetical protein